MYHRVSGLLRWKPLKPDASFARMLWEDMLDAEEGVIVMGLPLGECRIEAEQHILANSSDEVQVPIQDLQDASAFIGRQL